jgi:hypothetical protein
MGARHDPTLRAPEAMAARHTQAREAEAAARADLAKAKRRVAALKAGSPKLPAARQAQRRTARKEAAEARWKQARRDRVASDPKKYATGLVDARGNRISTQQIVEHMRAHPDHGGGPGELDLPGFVSHRLDTRGARSFFVNWWDKRQTVDSKTRTGEATRTGAHASDFAALAEHLVRGRGVVDAIKSFDGFARQVGVKRADGKHYTWAEAQKAAPDMVDAYGQEMVPVRVAPARYSERTRQGILDRQDVGSGDQALENLTVRRLDEALNEPPQGQAGTRNVVLVPKLQVDRFRDHQSIVSMRGARVGQAYTRIFRATVLPFSTKWLFGNAAEAVIRSVAYGITPLDIWRGAKFFDAVKRVDDETFKQLDVRSRGGLLYGSGDKLNVYRTDKSFENSMLETPAKILATGVRLPVIRQIGAGLGAYERAVFGLNRAMESRGFQTAVAGKFARKEIHEFTGSWTKAIRLQREALDEVARGHAQHGQAGAVGALHRRGAGQVQPFLAGRAEVHADDGAVPAVVPQRRPVRLPHAAGEASGEDGAAGERRDDAQRGDQRVAEEGAAGGSGVRDPAEGRRAAAAVALHAVRCLHESAGGAAGPVPAAVHDLLQQHAGAVVDGEGAAARGRRHAGPWEAADDGAVRAGGGRGAGHGDRAAAAGEGPHGVR